MRKIGFRVGSVLLPIAVILAMMASAAYATNPRVFDWTTAGPLACMTPPCPTPLTPVTPVPHPGAGGPTQWAEWGSDVTVWQNTLDVQAASGGDLGIILHPETAPLGYYHWNPHPYTLSDVIDYVTDPSRNYTLDYVFADIEPVYFNENANFTATQSFQEMKAVVDSVRNSAAPGINGARIGNYRYYPGRPDGGNGEDTFYDDSGVDVAMPTVYPWAVSVEYGCQTGSGSFPDPPDNRCVDDRNEMFFWALQEISAAGEAFFNEVDPYNPPLLKYRDHLIIPWITSYVPASPVSYGNQKFEPTGPIVPGYVRQDVQAAQTVTIYRAGKLDSVEVQIESSGAPGELFLEIQGTTSGVPNGNVLGSDSVPAGSVGPTMEWVVFDLSNDDIDVQPGDVLAIVLHTDCCATDQYIWRGLLDGTQYPYVDPAIPGAVGRRYTMTDGSNWGLLLGDQAFRTVLTPVPSEEPTAEDNAALLQHARLRGAKGYYIWQGGNSAAFNTNDEFRDYIYEAAWAPDPANDFTNFFALPGYKEPLNLEWEIGSNPSAPPGVEWSGMCGRASGWPGGACIYLYSNFTGAGQTLTTPNLLNKYGLPSQTVNVPANAHTIVSYPIPECSDGYDNDGDGDVDLADQDCVNPTGTNESTVNCGLGAELAPLACALFWLTSRHRRRRLH